MGRLLVFFKGLEIAQDKEPRINGEIDVSPIRLVGVESEQLGIVSLREALAMAETAELDLVEIAPQAQPPVCRIMDYGKYKYQESKKQHEAKRKQHIIQVKELKFRPNTDDHDYDFKKKHAIRFLQDGNRVKAMVQFRGREIAHVDIGRKLLLRFVEDLTPYGAVEGQPRLEGRFAHVLISPIKAAVKKEKAKDEPPLPGGQPAAGPQTSSQ